MRPACRHIKSFFLAGISVFLSFSRSFSQTPLPPVFEITSDTANYTDLPVGFWQILEGESSLTLDQAISSDRFHTDSSLSKGVNNSQHVYWFRLRLKNRMVKDADIIFYNDPYAEKYELNILRSGNNWQHLLSGVFIPYSKRDGIRELEAIPILIKPGEEIMIYKRIYRATIPYKHNDHHVVGFGFTARDIRSIYADNNSFQVSIIIHSFTLGVLLLAAIFNFFFFYINREKAYLYFALFLLCQGISFNGNFFWSFFKDYPQVRAYAMPLLRFLAYFFLVHFVRQLLHTSRYFPRWDKWLITASILPGICTLLALFIEPFLSGKPGGLLWLATTATSALLLIAVLITLIFFKMESNRLIRLMIISVLPALCLWTVEYGFLYIYSALSERSTVLDHSQFTAWLNRTGQTLEIIETVCLTWIAISFSWILFMRYSQLRKEKEMERTALIAGQKLELEKQVVERTAELRQSLDELKDAQSQLIQSEKMASLGELTAGIAHEIQNPLNFVNNFSEVNNELIEEVKSQKSKLKNDELDSLLNDIFLNNEKIIHHGKRADGIVKGMLQHSRTSTGQKELTDINAVADEYLRLAYHGLRAKDKSFNAKFETDFDPSIEKINIVPQEIGRVILNLISNAFYAVNEKENQKKDGYDPRITVSTKKNNNKVEIKVADNGTGIPQKVLDKIFQPFFTTKPTGEGTGLGLSLSYDIIKAHGGELKVESKEGEGATFIITIPVS